MSPVSTAEMITLFRKVEEEISKERGDFTLFGLFEKIDIFGKYDLVVSAPWLQDDRASAHLLFGLIRASIGNDRWFTKVRVGQIVPENGPFAEAVYEALPNGPIRHGFKRITNFFYDGEIIRDAVIITAMKEAEPSNTSSSRSAEPVTA